MCVCLCVCTSVKWVVKWVYNMTKAADMELLAQNKFDFEAKFLTVFSIVLV